MWQNGTTLQEHEREQIVRIVRRARNIWAGLCFLIAAVVFNSILRYGVNLILVIISISAFMIGIWFIKIGNNRVQILKSGTFEWAEDTVRSINLGGRYSRASISGTTAYFLQQLIFQFKKGDEFIGVRFHPDKQDKWYEFYNNMEPIAYKILR